MSAQHAFIREPTNYRIQPIDPGDVEILADQAELLDELLLERGMEIAPAAEILAAELDVTEHYAAGLLLAHRDMLEVEPPTRCERRDYLDVAIDGPDPEKDPAGWASYVRDMPF